MSDVSGIPNMGFGGGNFFAPQFSYNPQMSAGQASAAYMPAEYYAQNVTNNLYGGGANEGFGRQTDYYSALGASYSRASGSSNPYGVFGPVGGGGGGGEASPYYTTPNVFDTGASSFQGGGGSSGMGGSIYGGGGSYGGYGGDSFGSFGGGRQDPYPNMSMPGGLNSSFSSPSGAGAIDWGGLFGGARADPAPNMSMPGGQGSSMPMPQTQQQPSINWGDVGAAAGGSAPYTSGIAPDLSGGQTFAGGVAPSDPFPGMSTPGGLNSPMTTPEPGASFGERFDALGGSAPAEPRTYDFKPMFEAGGGGGFGSGGTESQSFGGNAGSFGGNIFDYTTGPAAPNVAEGTASGDKSAGTIAEEARARLAGLIGSPETAKAVEKAKEPDAAAIPLPPEQEQPYPQFLGPRLRSDSDQNPPRPPGDIPEFPAARLAPNGKEPELFVVHHTGPASSPEGVVNFWRTERPGIGTQYIMDRNGVVHDTLNEYGYGGTSHAKDLNIPGTGVSGDQGTSNRSIVGMEIIAKDERDVTPAQRAALVQFANERYPNVPFYGHGEISGNRMNDEGIPGAQEVLASRPAPFNFDWSNAPIPGPANERPTPAPTSSYGPLATQDAPTAEAVPLPASRPAAANIAQANSVLDSKVIDLVRKGSPDNVDRIPSSIANQTLREALGNTMTGGMIRSGLTPYLPQMGVSQAEFDKAYAGGQRAQFAEGGGLLGPYPAYTGPEAAPGGGFPDFSQSTNIDDRRDYSGLRSALGALTNNVLQAFDPRDMIERNTPIPSAGSDMSRQAGVPELNARLEGDPAIRQWYKQTDEYDRLTQDTGAAAPRFMGGGAAEGTALPGGMPSSQDLLGYTPQQWSAGDYPASFNERFGGEAAAPESTSMADFQSPASGYGSFQGAASPENRLEAQRAGFAAGIRDNPEKALQLAARLYSEDRNSPASRQAILEAMLNAQQASGRDPFDPKYYPKNTQQYRDALAKLSGNNDLLDRIYQEMETPFSGSNRSNYATDWASAKTAADERRYTTSTWTSPTDEQFFRKDISNDWTGPGRAAQNQKWYQTTTGRAR